MRQEYIRNRQHPLAEMVFFRCAQQITPNIPGLETRYYLATDDPNYRVRDLLFPLGNDGFLL